MTLSKTSVKQVSKLPLKFLTDVLSLTITEKYMVVFMVA